MAGASAEGPDGRRVTPRLGEPFDQLRDDVRLLGELVGEVLREQAGARLFETVERLRTGFIAARAAGGDSRPARERQLMRLVEGRPTGDLLQIVRAFSIYFHVINLAEQHHRLRTLAERARGGGPPRESVAEALEALRRAGLAPAAIRAGLERLEVHAVLTAHPSEARRRTLLAHLEAIAGLIDDLDDPRATPRARSATLARISARMTLLWQTAETRVEQPTVLDEVQSVIYMLANPLYDVAPRLRRLVDEAVTGADRAAPPLDAPTLLRFGSWVGGDRDGNPAVTPEVTVAAARLARAAILRRYREEVQALGRDLSISARLVGASPPLLESILADRAALGVQPVREWRDEPYRQKCGLIGERLRRTERDEAGGYDAKEDLLADLRLVEASLRERRGGRIADGLPRDLQRRVETFGFSLAELEVRQHAARHAAAVAELLGLAGVPDYAGLDEPGRVACLEAHLVGPPLAVPDDALSPPTREALATPRAVAEVQRHSGARACQTYIISMTRAPSDVLAVLLLAREAGLFAWEGGEAAATCRLDIVPLFETIDELRECGGVLERLLLSPAYRAALRARRDRQQVMVGYSDSNKDGGYLAATWATHGAQATLARACAAAGIDLTIFHGRGGPVGRGGGPMGRAILARPAEARSPHLKVTEQGEVIFARYGQPAIAERHLEQVLHALARSTLEPPEPPPPPAWVATMEALADRARRFYQATIKHAPAFLAFFFQATPFRELATLNLASRPVSRVGRALAEVTLDDLRAIPWVFSWTQCRVNLPGWYGIGTALQAEIDAGGLEGLQAMYRSWRFFAMALDNAQLSLGTADMLVARRYAALADDQTPMETIAAEHARAVAAILAVTGQQTLLESAPVLARSIRLRNPYVDALHAAQIALLRRARALPPAAPEAERAAVRDALHHSINGIAAGLQTTG